MLCIVSAGRDERGLLRFLKAVKVSPKGIMFVYAADSFDSMLKDYE